MSSTLLLLPTLRKWQLGFSYLVVHDLPQLACMQLFLVPYSFFVFCCWRRRASRYKQCCKGSWVPACPTSKASSVAVAVSVWARCPPNPLLGHGGPPTLLCVPAASHAHASEAFCVGAAATITACRLYSAHMPLFFRLFDRTQVQKEKRILRQQNRTLNQVQACVGLPL